MRATGKNTPGRATCSAPRNCAMCRCGPSLPGSTKSFSPAMPRCAAGSSAAAISTWTTCAAWAKSSARSWAASCRHTGASPPRARSRFPPRRTTTPSCRWCAIPTSPVWRTPMCPCRRASAIRATPAASSSWRANTWSATSVWRRWVCGRRRARSRTKSSPWPRNWASSGPPPIAACSTAPSRAPLSVAAHSKPRSPATDSGVLDRTQQRAVPVEGLYRPYEWRQAGKRMKLIFRDHFMSDLIGFVYSKMEASHAAADFLHRIRQNCTGIIASGRDALVPIILDGENAWEYYDHNGRPFLRELYRRISDDPGLRAVTASEAFRLMAPEPLDHIFPGSWINANFDIWIGAEEDNLAWTQLLRARATYDATTGVPEEGRRMAYEELLIAEGSDWCWWYGPEHDSANRPEFDQLYRSHLANVYRFLNITPPEELSRPILRMSPPDVRDRKS